MVDKIVAMPKYYWKSFSNLMASDMHKWFTGWS